jgi:hydrogenase nickel incorporation protein HypA/HybF
VEAVHEVGLMQDALALAEAEARSRGASHIRRITLRIGRLAGVETEALAFAFDVVAVGTMAEGATLQIETAPIVCFCQGCRTEFAPEEFVFACPTCQVLSRDVRAGQEMLLTSLEVTYDDD